MTAPTVTPTQRLLFREILRLPHPVTYADLGRTLDRSQKALESLVSDLRSALRPVGVSIVLQRRSRNEPGYLSVVGPAHVIAAVRDGRATAVPDDVRKVEGVTLPSIGGVSYLFAPEGRLVVGGVIQPARVA